MDRPDGAVSDGARPRLAHPDPEDRGGRSAGAAGRASCGASSACRWSPSRSSSSPGPTWRRWSRRASARSPGRSRSGSRPATCTTTMSPSGASEAAFYERQEKRNAARLAKDPNATVKWRQYTGKPTYLDQIVTSLKTVFMGFLLAAIVAVPLGVLCGLSPIVNAALNPLIQIFKPVSPLAWLPIVTMVVSATYVSDDPMFEKSFLNSAITVTLCSLWPTLINTALGVAVDRQGPAQCRARAQARLGEQGLQARPAVLAAADLHRAAAVARRRLDGADRGRDAGAEPGPREVRLGRVPERIVRIARARSWSRCSPSASSASCSTG